MDTVAHYAIPAMWLVWALYWWATAGDVKPAEWQESFASRAVHRASLILAFVLLSPIAVPLAGIGDRFLPASDWAVVGGAILTGAGLLFAVWARRVLGRNWSGAVTIKADHTLVTSGPYGITRHPIYAGVLIAFAGTALATGQWRGAAAVALAAASLWCKAALEERSLRRRFGASYEAYARRVVLPFSACATRRRGPRRR